MNDSYADNRWTQYKYMKNFYNGSKLVSRVSINLRGKLKQF